MITPNSQAGRLLIHLQAGKSITSLKAYDQLGTTQLATRITELENHGFKIKREWIKVTNRFGEKCRVVQYSLEEKAAA